MGVTEGVSSVGCSMPTIYTLVIINSVNFTVYVHRGTLPQSRIRSTAPSEREPGTAAPFIRPPKNRNVAGDFHRPYESSDFFPVTFIGGHSLSLAFARQLPQRGSRDGVRTIQRAARRPEGFGRFSSPLRRAGGIHRTAQKSTVSDAKTIPGGAGHACMGTRPVRN